MEIQDATNELIKHLKDDKDYFYSWQANIAMAIYDNLPDVLPTNKKEIHEKINEGAKYFLSLLIRN